MWRWLHDTSSDERRRQGREHAFRTLKDGVSMRTQAFRRHQTHRHMRRRLKEDRNEHYDDLNCPCWTSAKAMARFKEQPQVCSGRCCGNWRKWEGPTIQERRIFQAD
jgi:hypothetical protein